MKRTVKLKLVNYYIISHVVMTTLMVTVVMAGLYIFIGFISELPDIGSGGYGVTDALLYVLMTMPINIYNLFPMIALLGSLIGLGIMASRNEITILRASGMSVMRITRVVLGAAVIMVFIALAIGEGIGPGLANNAGNQKIIAKNNDHAFRSRQGIWLRDHNDFIYINKILPGMRLSGVTDFHFNNYHELQSASFSQNAYRLRDRWYLLNTRATYFDHHQTRVVETDKQTWRVTVNPNLLKVFEVQPDSMSLFELHNYIEYQQKNDLEAAQYDFNFWQRLFQPLAILVMIALGLSFVFGPLRSVTIGSRIVTGIIIGFSFYLLNRFLGPFSLVYQVSPIVAAAFPIVIFSLLSLWLLWRVK